MFTKTQFFVVIALVLAMAHSGASAIELGLPWRQYPTKAELVPQVMVSLHVQDAALHVDVRVTDPAGAELRSAARAPDGLLEEDSQLLLHVDGAGTGKYARVFGISPSGSVLDGTLREGQDVQLGADFVWTASAQKSAVGWTAQLRIPVSQLQLSPGGTPKVYITYRRVGQETEVYASGDIDAFAACALCAATAVPELLGLPSQANWQVQTSIYSLRGSADSAGYAESKASISGFWQINDTLQLRGTLNPNFAESEPDQPVLRYAQAFGEEQAEGRQFFAQSSDLLQTTNVPLISTRSIAAPNAAVGADFRSEGLRAVAMVAQEAAGAMLLQPGTYGNGQVVAPASRSALMRASWSADLGDLGFLLTQKSYQGGMDNTVVAVDGLRRFDGGYSAEALGAYSQSTACMEGGQLSACAGQAGHLVRVKLSHNQPQGSYFLSAREVSPGFRSDLGWVPQVGTRGLSAGATRTLDDPHSNVTGWQVQPMANAKVDWQGNAVHQDLQLQTEWVIKQPSIWTKATLAPLSKDRLSVDGPLFDSRWVEAMVIVSPSVRIAKVAFIVKAGELPDYYNALAGQGLHLTAYVGGSLSDQISFQFTAPYYRTRARSAIDYAGASFEEASLLTTLNWQYGAYSRWRYVLSASTSQGLDLQAGAMAFSQRSSSQSVLWEHTPRQAWRLSMVLTHIRKDGAADNWEALGKAGYAF